jgi:hypothetical protein
VEVVSRSIQKEIKEMRKNEIVKKNISLVFDFLRYLIDHPELIKKLPDGCELEFLDKEFPLIGTETSVEGAEKAFLKVEHTFNLAT